MTGLLVQGGPILWILLAMSVLSLGMIAVKVAQLLPVTGGAARRDGALARWRAGETEAAIAEAAGGAAPADRVLAHAMRTVTQGISGPVLEAEAARRGNDEVMRMSSLIQVLELIAVIGPLVGLLGTVTGMIQSFQDLAAAEGSANASVLAGGIWEALLTTAAGLVVAIPAAVAATLFNIRIEKATQKIELAVGELLVIEHAAAQGTARAAE
jgi:biopolymer transport protein ExbB